MGEIATPFDIVVHYITDLVGAVLVHQLDLPQHVPRSINQLVHLLDAEPLLVVHSNDEVTDEEQVLLGLTSQSMFPGPQVKEPAIEVVDSYFNLLDYLLAVVSHLEWFTGPMTMILRLVGTDPFSRACSILNPNCWSQLRVSTTSDGSSGRGSPHDRTAKFGLYGSV